MEFINFEKALCQQVEQKFKETLDSIRRKSFSHPGDGASLEHVDSDAKLKAGQSQALNDVSRKVIIVGAGFARLFALKHCLEEGLDATVYEANSYIGGRCPEA